MRRDLYAITKRPTRRSNKRDEKTESIELRIATIAVLSIFRSMGRQRRGLFLSPSICLPIRFPSAYDCSSTAGIPAVERSPNSAEDRHSPMRVEAVFTNELTQARTHVDGEIIIAEGIDAASLNTHRLCD